MMDVCQEVIEILNISTDNRCPSTGTMLRGCRYNLIIQPTFVLTLSVKSNLS